MDGVDGVAPDGAGMAAASGERVGFGAGLGHPDVFGGERVEGLFPCGHDPDAPRVPVVVDWLADAGAVGQFVASGLAVHRVGAACGVRGLDVVDCGGEVGDAFLRCFVHVDEHAALHVLFVAYGARPRFVVAHVNGVPLFTVVLVSRGVEPVGDVVRVHVGRPFGQRFDGDLAQGDEPVRRFDVPVGALGLEDAEALRAQLVAEASELVPQLPVGGVHVGHAGLLQGLIGCVSSPAPVRADGPWGRRRVGRPVGVCRRAPCPCPSTCLVSPLSPVWG